MTDDQITGEPSGDPEKDLACCVIYQAYLDATSDTGVNSTTPYSDREEAILFLTAKTGGWAISRVIWCDEADMNHEAVRDKAVALIAEAERKREDRFARLRSAPIRGMAA